MTSEGDEDPHPNTHVDVQLVKCSRIPCTQERGWSAVVSLHRVGEPTKYLLNILYAEEGTPLHSLGRLLIRLDDLSHVLAWTNMDPTQGTEATPTIDLVEMPRLGVSFRVEQPNGKMRLVCLDYGGLYVPSGPPSTSRADAWKLLVQMPHCILLQNENSEFSVLVPNVKPCRPCTLR